MALTSFLLVLAKFRSKARALMKKSIKVRSPEAAQATPPRTLSLSLSLPLFAHLAAVSSFSSAAAAAVASS